MARSDHLKAVPENGKSAPSGSQPEVRHYLAFEIHGFKNRFLYVVEKDEHDRVSDVFRGPDDDFPHFVSFNDRLGRRIHVNRVYILRSQSFYDVGTFEDSIVYIPLEDREAAPVAVYVIGRDEPFVYNGLEESAFEEINEQIDLYTQDTDFVIFADEDGEQNSIRADSILLVESWDHKIEEADQP
jgi:hypothetical protein